MRHSNTRYFMRSIPWVKPAGARCAPGRRCESCSERNRDTALPRDVVLCAVEAVAVELVDEVAAFGPHAEAPEAVLDARAHIARELGPRGAGAELVQAH